MIAGLGNELCSDDGLGVHACRRLGPRVAALGAEVLAVAEVGTAVGDALHLLEWADHLLIIDAMRAGGPAGSIYLAEPADVEEEGRTSLHQLGLLGALAMVELERTHGRAPSHGSSGSSGWERPQVRILGVEPASLSLGLELSPAVAAALPRVVAHAWELVDGWLAAAADV